MTHEEIRASMEAIGVARFKLPEHLVVVDALASTNSPSTAEAGGTNS